LVDILSRISHILPIAARLTSTRIVNNFERVLTIRRREREEVWQDLVGMIILKLDSYNVDRIIRDILN